MDQLGGIVIPGMNQVQIRPGECHCHGHNTDETKQERTETAQKMDAIRTRIAAGEVVMADPEKLIGNCVVLDPCGHIVHSRCMDASIAQWRIGRVADLMIGAAGDLPDLHCPTCYSVVDHKLIPPGLPPTPARAANREYDRGFDLAPTLCKNALKVARFCASFAVGCAIKPYLTCPQLVGTVTVASITDNLNRFVDAYPPLRPVMEHPLTAGSLSIVSSIATYIEDGGRNILDACTPTISTYFPWFLITLRATATTMPAWQEAAYNRNSHLYLAAAVTTIIGWNIAYDTARLYFDDKKETTRVAQLVDLTSRLFAVWSSFVIHHTTSAATRAIANGIDTHVGPSRIFRGMVGIAFKVSFLVKHQWVQIFGS